MDQKYESPTRRRAQWGRHHILYNPEQLTTLSLEWFDPRFWTLREAVRKRFKGRGQALAVDSVVGPVVLRPYRRGGWVARFVTDHYVFLGWDRSRSFREFVVLQTLFGAGLPVPEPVAALCARSGLGYRAALLTREIEGAEVLADIAESLNNHDWVALMSTLNSFFDVGLKHPDLNARNVLRDRRGRWHLIDFDRARLGSGPSDPAPMLERLKHSFKRLGIVIDESVLKT